MAAGEGFEPSQTESESGVLPLHKPAIVRSALTISRAHYYYMHISEKVKKYFDFFQDFFFFAVFRLSCLPDSVLIVSGYGKSRERRAPCFPSFSSGKRLFLHLLDQQHDGAAGEAKLENEEEPTGDGELHLRVDPEDDEEDEDQRHSASHKEPEPLEGELIEVVLHKEGDAQGEQNGD